VRELLTPRLRLRPITPDDLDDLLAVYSHPLVARWIGPQDRTSTERDLRRAIECERARGFSILAVEDRASGRFLGDCGLQPLEHRGPEVELGYDLHPDAWGRGIATEAARAVVADGFARGVGDRIVAVIRPENDASRRVLEKVGFRRAGEQQAYGIPMLRYEIGRSGQRWTVVSEFTGQAEGFNASAVARAPETLDDLVALAAPRAGERWLEAACGPGLIARRLAPHVGHVLGVDATPAMVELARREAAGVANADFAVGDATATGLPDGAVDGAIARFAIHHIPVPARLVEEMARVVRAGGRAVLADHLADDDADAAAWAQEIERLRDPSHWASLPLARLRALGERAGLVVDEERIVPIELDFEDWLARGSGGAEAAPLIERALRERPPAAECFAVGERDGRRVLTLRLWAVRWTRG
jgi:RimJ/RimL family protein N-acetyltransferase/SAM-dependent methyltransferase